MKQLTQAPFLFCLGFIGGVALSSWQSLNIYFLLGALIILITGSLFYFYPLKVFLALILIFTLSLILGIVLTKKASFPLNQLRQKQGFRREIDTTVKVLSEKETRQNYARYIVDFTKQNYRRALLLTDKHADYSYGDILKVKGTLELPENFSDFDYQGYLAKENIYYILAFPKVKLFKKGDQSFKNNFLRGLYGVRKKIRKRIIKGFPSQEGSFLRAILLGDKGVVSDNLREALARSGTSHIIAISGLHLSLLAVFLFGSLLFLGLWRRQATALAILFLIIFAVFIGFKASLIRAVFMASFALLALSSGHIFKGERVLAYIAFLMLFFNPLLLRYDVGFQLSFLAVGGILFLKPLLDHFFRKVSFLTSVSEIITVTIAAQLATLPIVASNFGIISLIAPLTNFIVLLMLPVVLGASFIWGAVAIFAQAKIFSILLYPLIRSILVFIQWTASFKFAAFELKESSLSLIYLLYYLILIGAVLIWRIYYRKNLTPLARWKKWSHNEKD